MPKGLDEYDRKRDFSRTPEPKADRPKPGPRKRRSFTVQKHDASRLHYDFRLEIAGALASWAVPKGPSFDPADKRLAVHVEDHPLDYGDFEGVIPAGNYGAGAVLLWDTGWWEPDEPDPAKALKKGKLSFTLHGVKLAGAWTLTRLRARPSDRDGDNWLLIKRDDEHARAGGAAVLDERPESVKTGRSLEEVAADGGIETKKRRSKKPASRRKAPEPASPAEAPASWPELDAYPKSRVPGTVTPQLCTLADAAPAGDDWLHEIKFDGYRLIVHRTGGTGKGVRLITRNGHDWTHRFGPIAEAIAALPAERCVVDGEATILEPSGQTSFQLLQQAIKQQRFKNLVFYAFDLLHLDGHDLTGAPLIERKALLRRLLPESSAGVLRYSDHVVGGGPGVQTQACELALEGMISKRADAPYTQGRARSWLKIKCARRQEFVVIGYSEPSGSRKHFGSLLLGAYDGDARLVYTGRVGTGFTAGVLKDIRQRLGSLERKTCPADEPPDRAESRGVTWVRPELVAEVAFTQWTDDGRLRHPAFQGLREDKPASEVRIERAGPTAPETDTPKKPDPDDAGTPAAPPARKTARKAAKKTVKKPARKAATPSRTAARRSPAPPAKPGAKAAAKTPTPHKSGKRTAPGVIVAGVTISNPDRVVFPDAGITKADLARYYEGVAESMLPFLINRPLSTVRCPQGRQQKCFFQKNVADSFTDPVRSITVPEKNGTAEYIAVDSVEGLVTLVQFGVIEIHPWGSRKGRLETPDTLTFDLDPGDGTNLDDLAELARKLREVLGVCGLESFLKVSGGKGLHVVVPLAPGVGWDDAKAFCRSIATRLAAESPRKYVATVSKAQRKGRVFIDYLRNSMGATSVAPFSARARAGGPCATPIRWEDLAKLESPAQYTIQTLPKRLARLRSDPWKGYHDTRQKLTPAIVEAVLNA